VGVVEKARLITGRTIAPGDAVLGLASSGAHSNGYSLVRRIIERSKPDLEGDFHGRKLADVLMEPTHIYVKPLLELMAALPVKGMAHITGGGIVENVPRVLPDGIQAKISKSAWPMPPLFSWLQREGGVVEAEMHRVFNCGIGMVVIVARSDAARAKALLEARGETVYDLGETAARAAGQAPVDMVA
jgi:phosphoribosylformylglycinamidine cyclo-ligase